MKKVLFVLLALLLAGCSASPVADAVDARVEPVVEAEVEAAVDAVVDAEVEAAVESALDALDTSPVIAGVESQAIEDGGDFEPVVLAEVVSDADTPLDELEWSCSGEDELWVRLTPEKLFVMLPNRKWTGSETIELTACDPDGQCASVSLDYTVLDVNDAPVLREVPGQVILTAEAFAPVALRDYVRDQDNEPEEMNWAVRGQQSLVVSVEDGEAVLTAPEGWMGAESLTFEACDPDGACDSAEAVFQVVSADNTMITYVHNAGFMFSAGEARVLIDSFHSMVPSRIRGDMLRSETPFEGVDLVLITHIHGDHFEARMVDSFMLSNPDAVVVAPPPVIRAIQAIPMAAEYEDRLMAVELSRRESAEITVNGIQVEVYNFPHGDAGDVNYGYVVHLNGAEILHPGDLSGVAAPYLEAYGFADRTLDALLVPAGSCTFFGDWLGYLENVFTADAVFLMHEAPEGTVPACEEVVPVALLFDQPLMRWVVP